MSIKYQLTCDCNAKFEGWFPSIEHFENQLAQGQLLCPMCDSTKVRRDIMAPSVAKKQTQTKSPRQRGKENVVTMTGENFTMGGRARTILKQVQKHVEETFENVGKEFPKEARKAHKGKRNEEFYGTATKKEAKELVNEGIDLFHIPTVKDH